LIDPLKVQNIKNKETEDIKGTRGGERKVSRKR